MKLLNHTSKYLFILLLPLLTIWAVIFYYALLDEIYDSLDDGLENQKVLLLQDFAAGRPIETPERFDKQNHRITQISAEEFKEAEDDFRDSLMYMQNEQEFEPVRIYESAFRLGDKYYRLQIATSMVEEDDLIKSVIKYLIILYLLLLASIILLNNIVLRKVWKPFYSLIAQLKQFRIEKENAIQTHDSNVEEFQLLNATVAQLTHKSRESYINQKQFIENAAHELQTPLAISINKLELFSEKHPLSDDQLAEIGSVLDNLNRLTRLNKSLLLLSKIENKQFLELERVDFNELLQQLASDFEDLLQHKQIRFTVKSSAPLQYSLNAGLATILVTNLLKNAIVHGKKESEIQASISYNQITISNTGTAKALNTNDVFTRFKKQNPDSRSTGLGLAIAKAIADRYHLQLQYHFDGQHHFTLAFPI
ncbi:two-component sensor histidine kinase [Pelobium manganitolerans]|uniref:histidine kinase n=1 Tax=Pelobium manganitolerans TaxID=1842495 RepID=A0A419S3C9_9SPHI|nr:HAMP domain-containing sensor histidine kinase [Pelobium manganitolerans]RKD13798.1 two-component sensor histidine kinase [Pelobium manganitolerans]